MNAFCWHSGEAVSGESILSVVSPSGTVPKTVHCSESVFIDGFDFVELPMNDMHFEILFCLRARDCLLGLRKVETWHSFPGDG